MKMGFTKFTDLFKTCALDSEARVTFSHLGPARVTKNAELH